MAPNRRSFVRKLGIAGAAVGAAATVGVEKANAQTTTDIDVLNFALNLEFLEAEFYTVATTGKTLKESGLSVGSKPALSRAATRFRFPTAWFSHKRWHWRLPPMSALTWLSCRAR